MVLEDGGGTFGLYSQTLNPPPLNGHVICVVDNGEPAITQSITTVPGETYELTVNMRLPELDGNGIPVEGNSIREPVYLDFLALNGGIFLETTFLVQNRNQWQTYTLNFVAEGNGTDLEFFDRNNADSIFINYITVTPAPEPSSLVLGWAGL